MTDRVWTPLHARFQSSLKRRNLLRPKQRLLVAVSGGQDSLCLLKLLLDLQADWQWKLAVAHCDHRWAGDVGNAEFVRAIAQAHRLPYFLAVADSVNLTEAGARQWRYEQLSLIAQQQDAAVVTGHTMSDRAETLLYNLVRGSGADGLGALVWVRSLINGIQLVRPLLDVTRAETGQFCEMMELTVWNDPANQNLDYARNRLRQDVLPYLKTHFNPQAERTLAQTAELLQADVECLEAAARQLLADACQRDRTCLNRQTLRAAPIALQRRAIRQLLQSLLPSAPTFEHIEKLVALIHAPNRTQTDPLPGGTIAAVRAEWIVLQPKR